MRKYKLETTKHGVWFTSDTHFDHKNIIRYCNRPFATVEEMNETLIENWNSRVEKNDFVFHVGDFTFDRDHNNFNVLLQRLNGQKILISGNHDPDHVVYNRGLISSHDLLEITVDKQPIVLCHYALMVWNRRHHGSWNLHGHSHGTLPDDPMAKRMDVGTDCNNYMPFSFQEVKAIMDKKAIGAVDHHKE